MDIDTYMPSSSSMYSARNLKRIYKTGRAIGKTLKRKLYDTPSPKQQLAKRSKKLASRVPLRSQRAKIEGAGGSLSSFDYGTYACKLPRSVYNTLMPQYKQTNDKARLSCTPGVQNAYISLSAFNGGDLTNLYGSSFYGRLLCNSVRAKTLITNQSSSSCMITIYDIVATRNINAATVVDPKAAWQEGDDLEGGLSTDWTQIGVTPFSSDPFKRNFHVRGKTDMILAQGVTHQHSVHYSPNRACTAGEFQYNSALSNLTVYTMIVFHGVPCNDSTTKTSATVTTGEVDLDIVTCKEMVFKTISGSATTVSIQSNLPTSFPVGESILNVGTGTATTETHA